MREIVLKIPRSVRQARSQLSGLALTCLLGTVLAGHACAEEPTASPIDLTRAVVVTSPALSGPGLKAAEMLIDDVATRSGVRWRRATGWPGDGVPVIAIGTIADAAEIMGPLAPQVQGSALAQRSEGFTIRTTVADRPAVAVAGLDARGVLFGVGRLLRELRTTEGKVLLPASFQIDTAPRYPLRGHQLGYRPKTNSYDGWDLPQWERYVRDLAIFGTNAVELIPPRSDDDADSPLFPRPPLAMMAGMSRLLDSYGLDVWIWYPAMDRNYADPATVDQALREWEGVFRELPRLDAVFVPGGDPGHTEPRVLIPFLEKVAKVLRAAHPRATLWVSPQGFNQAWMEQFLTILQTEPLTWLAGIVHGPQVRISMEALRKAVPARYPIRTYPDITHSQQCQFPVPDWDLAYSLTEGREVINPRPRDHSAIFRYYQTGSLGFITYSEGCNDDVNKFLWSGWGWDPDADVVDLLRQYGRACLSSAIADEFARGLLALEQNWKGPLLPNESVETTYRLFDDLWKHAAPPLRANWRFQQALYRACYDQYVRQRLITETRLENEVFHELGKFRERGSIQTIGAAESILDRPTLREDQAALGDRIRTLAEALFVSIRMQLSVPLFDAIAVDRGANLDTMDVPLSDRLWLREQMKRLRELSTEPERLRGIEALLHRTDPGPGGFYDDLGNLAKQPHLVRNSEYASDPDFRRGSLVGFGSRAGWPLAWCQNAQTLHDAPLLMRYEQLDPRARYRLRIVYAGDSFRTRIRLDAGAVPVHDLFQKPNPPVPVEFDVPEAATRDGTLTLSWRMEPGRGGNGRGCQVAEVWLIRKGATPVDKEGR